MNIAKITFFIIFLGTLLICCSPVRDRPTESVSNGITEDSPRTSESPDSGDEDPNHPSKTSTQRFLSCSLQFKNLHACGTFKPLQNPTLARRRTSFELQIWPENLGRNDPFRFFEDSSNFQIEVIPWMEMPDGRPHGSNLQTTVSKLPRNESFEDLESYLVKNVSFTMKGPWQLIVVIRQKENEVDRALFYIEI